jgi:hypothetical protein
LSRDGQFIQQVVSDCLVPSNEGEKLQSNSTDKIVFGGPASRYPWHIRKARPFSQAGFQVPEAVIYGNVAAAILNTLT